MLSITRKASSLSSAQSWFRRIPWLLIPVLALSFSLAHAQNLTGTLSGIVTDQTDARIPGAKVTITNDASGDTRGSISDSQGFFSITALPPATYTVTISDKGFATWKETGIVLNQGDSRTVANIKLKPSADTQAVTVISGQEAEVPVDNAEISSTLNNDLVDSATLSGRNAAELMKMMPGVVFNNGGGSSGWSATTTSTNNGPAGSFSANGTQPYGSTAIILDGANLVDPGNAGTQIANINQDMTDSVKFASASYGAEYAKGPAVLEAFSKSGGQKFHGEGYFYARNTGFGYANDALNKYDQVSQGLSNSLTPQHFYYIGGNVGGPVFFPGFNKNKDKLFFWAGYEKMIQAPFNEPVVMNVPTAAQLGGDFSNTGVNPAIINAWSQAYVQPCNNNGGWEGCTASAAPWAGGGLTNLAQYFDTTGLALSKLNPAANITPLQGNSYNNFQYSPNTPTNRWEVTGKVNYSFNENNKLWGSYTYQTEVDAHPLSIWWAPEWTIPYPGQPVATEKAHVYLANYTHVFNATTTNEVVFSYAEFVNDAALSNKAAVSRTALGIPDTSLFGTPKTDQIPNSTGGWNSGLTEINEFDFNSGIYGAGTFGKTAKVPAITDNFTKIVRTHSLKAGFYWDNQENLQANGSDINGNYDFENWGATSTANLTLDRLMGRSFNYDEYNTDVVPDINQHEWSIWAQDSWKTTRKLTLNLGLRADHEGQWYDKLGGTQVWDQSAYLADPTGPNAGFEWHQTDSKIPTSGWVSQLLFYNPRLGAAYDVFGTGKTVIRGGFGTYRYQVSSGDASAAMGFPLGSFDYSTYNTAHNDGFFGYGIQGGQVCTAISGGLNTGANCTGTTTLAVPSTVLENGGSLIKADALGDNRVPFANTYSFGVAQALPAHTVVQASWVGSTSKNQLENGGNGHIQDANELVFGRFSDRDPATNAYENLFPYNPALIPTNSGDKLAGVPSSDYFPLSNAATRAAGTSYGDIWIQTHGGHANYNSLQIAAQKQSGNLFLFTNFTFGKVLGTRDGSTNNGNGNGAVADPFNFEENYGQLEYDHTKVFNASYSYKLPKPIHNNLILGEVINGWQISGYTTYQDGVPYQTTSVNMNMNYQQYVDPTTGKQINYTYTQHLDPSAHGLLENSGGTVLSRPVVGNQTQSAPSSTTFWGSSQPENGLMPIVTCDPRHGLSKGQYFNPNCFRAPIAPTATAWGEVGQTVWPYIRTPHYWGSDMAIFKAFKVTDVQRVEVRISATNWLNHPNAAFGLNGTGDNKLNFNKISHGSTLVTNSNELTTGFAANKAGFRFVQFAAKYYF